MWSGCTATRCCINIRTSSVAGQRQRMMVARAYLLKPDLIVADEPVSMVDASLRAMILDIMLRLRDEHGISFLYITHDLSTAYQVGDDIYPALPGLDS